MNRANRTITKCRRLSFTFNEIYNYNSITCRARRGKPSFNSRVRCGRNKGLYWKSIRLISKRSGSNTMYYHSYSFMRQYVFSDLIRRIY